MFDKPQRVFDLDGAFFPVEMRNVFAEPGHHQNEPLEDFISAISNASFDFDRYLGEARLHGERLMLLRPKVEAQTFYP